MTRTVVITEQCDGVVRVEGQDGTARCPSALVAGSHRALNTKMREAGWRSRFNGKALCKNCQRAGET